MKDCINCRYFQEQRLDFNNELETIKCIQGTRIRKFSYENTCSYYCDNDKTKFIKTLQKKGELVL